LVNKELPKILSYLEENLKGQLFSLKLKKKVFFEILEQKNTHYDELKDKIRLKWQDFKKKNNKKVVKKTYTAFLYENFHDFFKFYIVTFFGLESKSLELTLKENISETDLILEYKYYLSPEEIDLYDKFSNELEGNLYGTLMFTGYVFSIVTVLGNIIRHQINEKILISVDCGIIKKENDQSYLNFLILVRPHKKEIFDNYINMTLFYFLKQFKGIPNMYFDKLFIGREELYELALKEYKYTKDRLADLFFYFYNKCQLLQNICPLLDFFNFVCSRVEDSIFDKFDVIKKDLLPNFNYSVEKNNSLLKIFEFLDKQSTLYSTFFANNLPGDKAQLNLFLLYMKYYFGSASLENLEVGNILFLPEIFRKNLNDFNKKARGNALDSNAIKDIEKIITYFGDLSNKGIIDLFFNIIFKKGIAQLNYSFFRSFLKSFNKRLLDLIDIENKALLDNSQNEPLTFNIIVEHISRMLYVLIEKIFIRAKPDLASKNFIDPRGRYIGKNIALRTLELFIFQEINYSDDIWDEILISLNKDEIRKSLEKYVSIPDKHFYSDKDITRLQTIYNLQSFSNVSYFEEWLIYEIINPLNNFINTVRNSIKNPSNEIEIYERLSEVVLKNIEPKEKNVVQDLRSLCQQLAHFWKTSEKV
jgi:hypothetical protein